jgi:hypothetical protein
VKARRLNPDPLVASSRRGPQAKRHPPCIFADVKDTGTRSTACPEAVLCAISGGSETRSSLASLWRFSASRRCAARERWLDRRASALPVAEPGYGLLLTPTVGAFNGNQRGDLCGANPPKADVRLVHEQSARPTRASRPNRTTSTSPSSLQAGGAASSGGTPGKKGRATAQRL